MRFKLGFRYARVTNDVLVLQYTLASGWVLRHGDQM